MKDLLGFFDEYTIKARFFPAMLAVIPLIALIFSYININQAFLSNVVVGGLTIILAIFLLSNFARAQGLRVQKKLLKEWKVFPTTQFLRHRDTTISKYKKQILHDALHQKSALVLPTEADELANPANADEQFEEVINWLKEKTRGTEFIILLKENIHYGFMRNSLGLKYIAIFICFLVLSVLGVLFWLFYPSPSYDFKHLVSFTKTIKMALWLTFAVTIIMLFLWFFAINKKNVRKAAERYAHAILNSIHKL